MAHRLLLVVLIAVSGGVAFKESKVLGLAIEPELPIQLIVEREALMCGVNPSLLRSLAFHESRFDADAVSNKGAIGLLQVMPFNAERCGMSVRDLFDPTMNARCGCKLLKEHIAAQGGDLHRGIQSYNGGSRCVGRCSESLQLAKNVINKMATDTK